MGGGTIIHKKLDLDGGTQSGWGTQITKDLDGGIIIERFVKSIVLRAHTEEGYSEMASLLYHPSLFLIKIHLGGNKCIL